MAQKINPLVTLNRDFTPGDWVKMDGVGFVIYGKVTICGSDGEMRIITSTVVDNRVELQTPVCEMRLVKIEQEEVPQRARLWILSRVSHPPKGPDANPDPRRLTGP